MQNTVNHVKDHMQYPIVYGDTDSIMINANTDQLGDAIKIGHKIKETINKNYKYLEIEIDGIFQPLLLLKKKKYASKMIKNLGQLMNGQATEAVF